MSLSNAASFAVAAYTLDEETGTRANQLSGSYHLTQTGAVGFTAGKFGNAADFNLLGSLDAAEAILPTSKIMFRAWVRPRAGCPDFANFFSQGAIAVHGVALNWRLDHFGWNVRGSLGIQNIQTPAGSGVPGTWALIHAWFDDDANELGICVNAGPPQTITVNSVVVWSSPFRVGTSATGGQPLSGEVDDMVVLSNYVLDAAERTADFNGGAGVAFATWAEPSQYPAGGLLSRLGHAGRLTRAGHVGQLERVGAIGSLRN